MIPVLTGIEVCFRVEDLPARIRERLMNKNRPHDEKQIRKATRCPESTLMQDFDGYVVKRIVALLPALPSQDALSTPVMPGQCSGQHMLLMFTRKEPHESE